MTTIAAIELIPLALAVPAEGEGGGGPGLGAVLDEAALARFRLG